jgi:hypothetical protein
MRNLLLAALMVSSFAPLHDAVACGVPEPVVYRLTSKWVQHYSFERERDYRRTFAIFPEPAPANLKWRQLSHATYEHAAIAMGTPFANPLTLTLTLVGPSATRVVKSTQHVFLRRTWEFSSSVGAIEVPQIGDYEHFEIALSGSHPEAKWHRMEEIMGPQDKEAQDKDLAWVKSHGVGSKIVGTFTTRVDDIELIQIQFEARNGATFVRRGTATLGLFDGHALGAFELDGVTKLVIVDGANVKTVEI